MMLKMNKEKHVGSFPYARREIKREREREREIEANIISHLMQIWP